MIGQQLRHYRLVAKIGAGGMGVVYRARDEHLEREVAIKVLPTDAFSDETARKRFRKEALALAKLSSPYIAHVHDFATEGGVDFLVMELVPGRSLAETLTGSALPEREVLRMGVQLASALEEAHGQGIVHRDLKPGNLMLTPKGELKVLDFGLAKLLQEPAADATTLSGTQIGVLAGTLPYMAPEQLRTEGVDRRTDIWAAGVVLYELMTGRRPFADEVTARLTDAILNRAPALPTSVNRKVSPGFEQVVLKCLEKDPERRYQSAKELGVDLSRLLTPTSVDTKRVAPRRPFAPRWLAAVAAVLVAIAGAIVLLKTWRTARTASRVNPPIASLAVLPLDNMTGDPEQEYFADGMTEALITELSMIGSLKVISRTSAMRYKGTDKPMPQIARELGVDGVIEGSVQREGDQVRITVQLIHGPSDSHVWADSYQRELRGVLALQSAVAQAIVREIRLQLTPQERERLALARAIDPEAHELYLKGRYQWNKRTEEGFRRSIEYFQQAIEKDPAFAPAHVGLADTYLLMGGYHRILSPRDSRPAARAAVVKALELDGSSGEAHASLAQWHHHEGDWAAAEQHFKRALDLSPSYATAFHWYSNFVSVLGRHDEALKHIRRAQELDPLSAVIAASSALQLFHARRYDDGIEECDRVVLRFPDFPWAYLWRGAAYIEKASFRNGLADLERATTLGDRSPFYYGILAHAYGRAGSKASASRVLEELEQLSEQRYVSGFDRALAYIGIGDNDKAMAWLERAYEARDVPTTSIKVSPWFDGVRDDRRFQALLRRMSFPE